MPDCGLIAACIFFNDKMARVPHTAGLYKEKYCRTDSSTCARFMVAQALGRQKVPADLFPNDVDRARKLLADAGKTKT
jgi:hypothetical protein